MLLTLNLASMMLAFGLIAKPKASMNGVDRKDKKFSCKFFLFTGVMNNISILWDPYVMVFFFPVKPSGVTRLWFAENFKF